MADTIFYKGKLKRGKNPLEVFEKIKKGIKKKGPTKDWVCTIHEDIPKLQIDFPDNESENFILTFNEKGEFNSFCKVYFPLEGELFEDGKSEFKALLDAFYNAKSFFNNIEITDDFGLAESYWDSKRFKFDLRTLTYEEEQRVKRLYSNGYTTHEDLLRAIMAEDMEMPVSDLANYINIDICYAYNYDYSPQIQIPLYSYLYETAVFCKEGRLCEVPDYMYYDLGKIYFSVFAFVEGISWIFLDGTGYDTVLNTEKKRAFSQKDAQVGLLFREKFAPLFLEETDELNRCILAYRYFVSVYDFLGFEYAGKSHNLKTVIEEIIEIYGEEKGVILLNAFCTSKKYIFSCSDNEKKQKYARNLERHLKERYGDTIIQEYLEFKKEYEVNMKFDAETDYMAYTRTNYIDDSLVLD